MYQLLNTEHCHKGNCPANKLYWKYSSLLCRPVKRGYVPAFVEWNVIYSVGHEKYSTLFTCPANRVIWSNTHVFTNHKCEYLLNNIPNCWRHSQAFTFASERTQWPGNANALSREEYDRWLCQIRRSRESGRWGEGECCGELFTDPCSAITVSSACCLTRSCHVADSSVSVFRLPSQISRHLF